MSGDTALQALFAPHAGVVDTLLRAVDGFTSVECEYRVDAQAYRGSSDGGEMNSIHAVSNDNNCTFISIGGVSFNAAQESSATLTVTFNFENANADANVVNAAAASLASLCSPPPPSSIHDTSPMRLIHSSDDENSGAVSVEITFIERRCLLLHLTTLEMLHNLTRDVCADISNARLRASAAASSGGGGGVPPPIAANVRGTVAFTDIDHTDRVVALTPTAMSELVDATCRRIEIDTSDGAAAGGTKHVCNTAITHFTASCGDIAFVDDASGYVFNLRMILHINGLITSETNAYVERAIIAGLNELDCFGGGTPSADSGDGDGDGGGDATLGNVFDNFDSGGVASSTPAMPQHVVCASTAKSTQSDTARCFFVYEVSAVTTTRNHTSTGGGGGGASALSASRGIDASPLQLIYMNFEGTCDDCSAACSALASVLDARYQQREEAKRAERALRVTCESMASIIFKSNPEGEFSDEAMREIAHIAEQTPRDRAAISSQRSSSYGYSNNSYGYSNNNSNSGSQATAAEMYGECVSQADVVDILFRALAYIKHAPSVGGGDGGGGASEE